VATLASRKALFYLPLLLSLAAHAQLAKVSVDGTELPVWCSLPPLLL
jgi:hypothetical protein